MPTRPRPAKHHPEGGRKARRAYAARPYQGPRDAGFYGTLWAAGTAAAAGGASPTGALAAGGVWAIWLLLSWRFSVWLRGQEDFDSPAVDTMASPNAAGLLFIVLPALAAAGAFVGTGGRLWWEPLAAAGLAGMAAGACSAFLERGFRAGMIWAAVALLGALGRPGPAWEPALLAGVLGVWYFAVTAGQERAFRHTPDGPFPEPGRLPGDAAVPAALLLLTLIAAWVWTPSMTPRAAQILPATNFHIWAPGERGGGFNLPFFGPPPVDIAGVPLSTPSSESVVLERMIGTAAGAGTGGLAAVALGAVLILLYLAWKKRRKAADKQELEKRRETLRGPGVQPKARAVVEAAPEDPRLAVVY